MELAQSFVKLTISFGIWVILLGLLVSLVIIIIITDKKQCKKIREEKDVYKLEDEKDKCEAVNAIFTGVYLAMLFWMMKNMENIWTNILQGIVLLLVFVMAIVLQKRLYCYKKTIRERNKK